MYTLLVLGIIPGTNIQISFQLWLQLLAGLVDLLGLLWVVSHVRHRLLLAAVLAQVTTTRTPLYANQLHRRGL